MNIDDLRNWDWVQANKSKKWPRLYCAQLAKRVESHPNDPVLSDGTEMLTVEQLARRASSIAVALRAESDDRPVVLFVDWSLASVVSIVGVQWSGRCLIPLNANETPSRLSAIVARIGECTVVDATGGSLGSLWPRSSIDISNVAPAWIDPVAVPGVADSLVVFTSGSTGEPKGVVQTGWQDDVATFRRGDSFACLSRSAILSPLNWLGGLGGLRAALSDGYILYVDPLSMPPRDLVGLLNEQRIDVFHCSPSLIETVGHSLDGKHRIDSLILARMFGEPLRRKSVEAAQKIGGLRTKVMGTYGSSEVLGPITQITIEPDVALSTDKLPMGPQGADFVRFEPFDSDDSGVSEIVVHKWVSERYWNDPVTTARVFGIDDEGNPFYRTGDLVEVDTEGNIWYVGRADDVIKISGTLVNPSEAAKVLTECDGVRRAVVLPRTLSSGRKSLVAHVAADAAVDPDTLRSALAERLPSHLVPAVIMRHDELPLLPGGKVDRQQLLNQPVKAWRNQPVVEPRDGVESVVVREAALLLGLESLSAEDDLWSMGLDSLGAIELCETLAQALNPGLTVNDFIGAATPAAIARRLAHSSRVERSHIVQLVEGDDPHVFIVAGGGAPALSYRQLARRIGNGGVIAYEQWGLMQRHRPDRSVRASAKRNLDHIRDVCTSRRPVLIGHSWGGLVAHEMATQLRRDGLDPVLVLLDSGRTSQVGIHLDRPSELKIRVRPWPLYVARLFYWRFHRFLAPIWQRRRSDRRYLRLFRHAVRVAQRHDVGLFGGPTLLVSALESPVGNSWTLEPDLRVVSVSGDHNSILQPPHVEEVARHIMSFISEYSAAPTASREG